MLSAPPPCSRKGRMAAVCDATLVPFPGENARCALCSGLRAARPTDQDSDQEIREQCRWQAEEQRPNQCWPDHSDHKMPVEIVSDDEMSKCPWRRRALQHPTTDFVFEKVDGWHGQQKDVMQIGGDRGG